MTGMEAAPLRGFSGVAMLDSSAYLTLPHPESDIPGHPRPIPLELKAPNHPPSFSMSLLMGVPDQLSAKGNWTDYPLTFLVIRSSR